MNVSLEKAFPMPGSAQQAWRLLQNIESVAACMPGAKITERLDEQHYKGTVSVKFGPATMSFRGEIEVREINPASHTLHLIGKGTDSTGSSGASMDLTARIEPGEANSSTLIGQSEVSVSGKAAAFGGRMMNAVADQVLKQFAANFAAQLQNSPANPPDHPAPADPSTDSPNPAADAGPAQASTQLNAFALVWGMIKDWLSSLFAARKS